MNCDIKPELQESCRACSQELFNSNTVTITEEILELLKFLTLRINSSVLLSVICESCLEKIKDACKFKSSVENSNEETTSVETPCGKVLIVCSGCKNIVPKKCSMPLLEVPYIQKIVKEEVLEKLINTYICESCQMSMSALHGPLDSLLVYCRNQTNNNGLKIETNEDVVDIKDESIMQTKPSNVNGTYEMKVEIETSVKKGVEESKDEDINSEDFQIHQEELDLKMECDEVSDHNEDGPCSEDKLFKCNICKYQTKYKEFLNKHMSNHKSSISEKFNCPFCEYKVEHKQCLIVLGNDTKMLQCRMCVFTSSYRSLLKRHMSVHNEAELFRCYLCDYNAKSKTLVEEHLIIHKPVPEVFRCSVCQYETKYRECLIRHLLVHENFYGIKKLHCTECKYRTNRMGHLKDHMLKHKPISETEIFKCDLCTFQTKYKNSLKNHALVHKDVKEIKLFKCHKCNYRTKHQRNSKRHMLNHKDVNEIEMFKCQNCKYETKYKECLKKHSVVHKDVNETELFRCYDCEYVTKHKGVLRKHILRHTKIKNKDLCCKN